MRDACAQVIIMLRDPIQRAESLFNHWSLAAANLWFKDSTINEVRLGWFSPWLALWERWRRTSHCCLAAEPGCCLDRGRRCLLQLGIAKVLHLRDACPTPAMACWHQSIGRSLMNIA